MAEMIYDEKYEADIEKVLPYIPDLQKLFYKTILITGAAGMICSSIADILFYLNEKKQAGITICLAGRSRERMAQRFAAYKEGRDYTFVFFEAASNQELDVRADYVIHGASNANPAVFTAEPVETILGNINGTKTVLDAAAKYHAARVLYISSSEVYGNRGGREAHIESEYGSVDILNPRACYPSAKRLAETLCVSYQAEFGVDTVIVRPGHIYGPTITAGDTRASAQFSRNAARHENIVMKSAGLQLRSYCYTLDCASAILTILLRGERGEAYNISGEGCLATIREMAEALAEAGGVQIEYEQASDAEIKGYNLMSNSSLNGEKLKNLGWMPAFSLQEGAERTLALLRLNLIC